MDAVSPTPDRSGLEPELGGVFRDQPQRTGFEPELGGQLRQKAAYVDEITCIGCKHCAHVAPNTFYIEPEYGRSRVFNQDGDSEESIQEAIDTCPVDCIHWVNYSELKDLEELRKYQVIKQLGYPQVHRDVVRDKQRKRKLRPQHQTLREKSNQNN
ncbi:ferredoxin [Gloeothece verrucosa]|uniref:Ferredoxin n=1 Tax=Gloeothece verrucosa (strain PCC 7822) TaxID=497965 RepID=E0UKD4_GLOV7|nr:ferredoxin [Gloeothece verrucosa]ADN17015.1 ferredoxin-like protein [Gloeothece verrucosa PCC 7822]